MDGPSGPTPERRWRERTWSEAEGRMVGQAFLLTFFATEKSESPEGAKQEPSEHSISNQGTRTYKAKIAAP
jgi:hypothetical protein